MLWRFQGWMVLALHLVLKISSPTLCPGKMAFNAELISMIVVVSLMFLIRLLYYIRVKYRLIL